MCVYEGQIVGAAWVFLAQVDAFTLMCESLWNPCERRQLICPWQVAQEIRRGANGGLTCLGRGYLAVLVESEEVGQPFCTWEIINVVWQL